MGGRFDGIVNIPPELPGNHIVVREFIPNTQSKFASGFYKDTYYFFVEETPKGLVYFWKPN